MSSNPIRFDDGAAYEQYMGKWSQLVGDAFLDWLAPRPGWRWLDVGCGNGAFTETLIVRCAPASVAGIDPSEHQLAYARGRPALRDADLRQGDATALAFPDDSFDAAVMPLVIFFVPEPAKGVAEMARVVRPGGAVTAYAWDMPGGGFPYAEMRSQLHAMKVPFPTEARPDVSTLDALRDVWTGAGLQRVETKSLTVRRTFADFEQYWATILGGPSFSAALKTISAQDLALIKSSLRTRFPSDASGRITYSARANAVKGHVAG